MRIEYINWATRKILCHTLIENIERVTNMRIEYINWATRKILCHTLIEKYRKGNEYAYRVY
jgi:hypothetical protein